jgi:hypothetical protein
LSHNLLAECPNLLEGRELYWFFEKLAALIQAGDSQPRRELLKFFDANEPDVPAFRQSSRTSDESLDRHEHLAAGSVVTKNDPKCAGAARSPENLVKYRDVEKSEQLCTEGKFC